MLPDCKPIKGKVKGPVNIQLCDTHHHVLDVDRGVIVAKDVASYEAMERKKEELVWKKMADTAEGPMAADCKPVRGKMKGTPDNIQLCEKHKHVLDVKAKKILAKTEADFARKWEKILDSV